MNEFPMAYKIEINKNNGFFIYLFLFHLKSPWTANVNHFDLSTRIKDPLICNFTIDTLMQSQNILAN